MPYTRGNDYATAVTVRETGDIALVGYTFGDLDGASLRGFQSRENCDVFVAMFAPDGTRR